MQYKNPNICITLSFIIGFVVAVVTLNLQLHLNINEVLIYCNTKQFIKNMVSNQYKMQLAAEGLVQDERHKDLARVEMWINPNKKQWAVVFVYKGVDKSCILGGNEIELHTP